VAIKRPVDGRGQTEGAGSLSVTSKATEPLVEQGMSFPLSFRQALLRPTGEYWLDDLSDVSCKETTRQHAVDDCQLSCKQQAGVSPPPAPEGVTR
jgi:hypothetical protein